MAGPPQSWQDVRSMRDLRPAGPTAVAGTAAATGDVQPLAAAAFQAIAPYRCFDSRLLGAPLPSGSEITLVPWRDVEGVQRIPEDVVAVTYNLTVTATVGGGFVSLYPAGTSFPGVSSVNWSGGGATVANNGSVRTGVGAGPGRRVVALVAGGGSAQVILDVTGYYA